MRRRLWIPVLALTMMASVSVADAAASKAPARPKKSITRVSATKPAAGAAKSQPRKPAQAKALPKLLDLGADKCIPCKMMFPVLDDLRKGCRGKLTVEFIDVWKNPGAKDKYGIRIIPTQIFYDSKGKELFRHEGYFPKEDILAEFRKHGVRL